MAGCVMTRAEIVRRLMVERFGPPQVLARERWLPIPADRKGLCAQGPSVYQKVLEVSHFTRGEDAA